jgi:tryptophan 2,3-dioxygenase
MHRISFAEFLTRHARVIEREKGEREGVGGEDAGE